MNPHNRASIPTRIWITLLIVLVATNIFFLHRSNHLAHQLENIKIVHWENNSLFYPSGYTFANDEVLFSESYINGLNPVQSPFKDGQTFLELTNKFVRNPNQDYYGANRRTRGCKRIHEGIDLFVPENTPLYPLGKLGVVTQVSDDPHFLIAVPCVRNTNHYAYGMVEYGKMVRILYPDGYESVYAHMNEVYVKENQVVTGDTKIGLTGTTGNLRRSGKPSHLHVEIRMPNGNSIDPRYRLHYELHDLKKFLRRLPSAP